MTTTRAEELRQSLQEDWDRHVEEMNYHARGRSYPKVAPDIELLEAALAEEFERGYKARMEDEKIPEPGAWVHGDGGL